MDQLPGYGLANTATAFATLFGGVFPLLFCFLMHRQPLRWVFVYAMIVVTGVFTVTLHGFGQTNPIWGERWFWSFLDTGSNIVVTWAVALAVLGDYYSTKTRRWAVPLATLAQIVGLAWHYYDRLPSTGQIYVIPLGRGAASVRGSFSLFCSRGSTWASLPRNGAAFRRQRGPCSCLSCVSSLQACYSPPRATMGLCTLSSRCMPSGMLSRPLVS